MRHDFKYLTIILDELLRYFSFCLLLQSFIHSSKSFFRFLYRNHELEWTNSKTSKTFSLDKAETSARQQETTCQRQCQPIETRLSC